MSSSDLTPSQRALAGDDEPVDVPLPPEPVEEIKDLIASEAEDVEGEAA